MEKQIEHGVLFLLAQYKAFGHAIPGIVEPTLELVVGFGLDVVVVSVAVLQAVK